MTADTFDPQRIVAVLNRHQVEYVLVGGYAAQLYGARRRLDTIRGVTCLHHLAPSSR